MYKQLMDECNRIKTQCWLQRMAAARFMENLELYQDGLITHEELLCFMPTQDVPKSVTLPISESSTLAHVSHVRKNAA